MPTKMVVVDYKPTFPEGKYITRDSDTWKANYEHRPVLSNIKIDDTLVGEMTELPKPPTDPNESGIHSLSADITVGEKCARYWIHAQEAGSYITVGLFPDVVTLQVITNAGTTIKNETGNKENFMINEWATSLNNFDLFIVWQDTDGNYYQYEEVNLEDYLKK